MQLQQNLEAFTQAGIRVFAVSYDSVEVLAKFAREFGITYPLLSDEQSEVIRRFGILNTLIRPDETEYYGLPYPGAYAVGEDGLVTEKSFFRYYRVRPSAQSVLKDMFDIEFDAGGDPHVEAAGDGARISAVLSSDGLVFMQQVPLYVRIELDAGLHVYRAPVPEGFVATEVTVTGPSDLVVEPAVFPDAHPFRVVGIPHEFQVMDGAIEIEVPVQWIQADNAPDAATVVPLEITVRYQACDETQCFIPRTVVMHLDAPVGRLYRAMPPGAPPPSR